MATCFDVLGVSSDVSLKDLKRRYFSLIREYPPQSQPEKFKEIRMAYEEATEAVINDVPVFPMPKGKKEKALQEDALREKSNNSEMLHLCEKGMRTYPKNPFFLYHVTRIRLKQSPRSAASYAEKLLNLDKENRHYQMLAATSFIKSNWTKKAKPLFQRVMEKGARNVDFLIAYSEYLEISRKVDAAYQNLKQLISENINQSKDALTSIKNAIPNFFVYATKQRKEEIVGEAIDTILAFIKNSQNILGEHLLGDIAKELDSGMKDAHVDFIPYYSTALNRLYDSASSAQDKSKITGYLGSLTITRLENDKRFPKCVSVLYRAFIMVPAFHPNAVKMDAKLCGIMEREKLLAAKPLLKKEYPELYTKLQPFFRSISTEEKADALKAELVNRYEEYDSKYFPDSKRYYYELFPDEMPDYMIEDDDDDWDDWDDDDDDDDFDREDFMDFFFSHFFH